MVPNASEICERIIRYETEGLPDEEHIQLFQDLVDSGLAWTLQGCYGREAAALIRAGLVLEPKGER